MVFEKILVPLDGSEHSARALELAVQIAKKVGGKITLIHVYSVATSAITPMQVSRYVQEMRKNGAAVLADGEKKAMAEGVQVEKLLLDGHAVEEILKTAREGSFNLVIVGARGMSRVKELLLGSVSEGVTRHAPCPVLVAR